MKIVILDAYTSNPGDLSWDKFSALGELCVYERTAKEEILERCKDAEIILDNKVVLDRETLAQLPKLKYIGVLATGYNIIDVQAATELGITVCNVPTYSTRAVAQLTFALILEFYNGVAAHNEAVHAGEWTACKDFCFQKTPLLELSGKTFGIVGFGKIGQEVAKIADVFGMNILCCVKSPKPQPSFENFRFVSLDELAEKSDIISFHCPLTQETKGLVNAEFISKMKNNAIIINTARGPIIDEKALAAALDSGKIAGAAVDVLSCEPPKSDNPLLSCKNCIITPHIAWAGYETRERLLEIVYQNLKSFLDGEPINVVNIK